MEQERLILIFKRRLRELMEQRGVNMNQLAKSIAVDRQVIYRVYHGKGLCSLPVARALAIFFNVSLDYFAAVPFQGVKHER